MRNVKYIIATKGSRPASAFTLGMLMLALAGATPAQTGEHRHDGAMQGMKGPRAGLAASAAFDAQGTLWAVSVESSHVVVRTSKDEGRTWSAPVNVNARSESIESDGDSRPRIAIGPQGDVYVTWTKPLSKPYTGEIRFARSQDGGKSFSPPRAVHADRQEITHRFDSLALSAEGKIFVAWVDKRDQVAAGGKEADYRGAAIYYAVSDDRGTTFRGDFKVADNSCECCRIALLPQRDGSMTALWRHVFAPDIRDHALATLHPDGRVAGFRRATFDDWHIAACPHHGPSLAADGSGQLHAVWFSGAASNPGAFYGRLGKGHPEGVRRIGNDTAEHPDIAVDGNKVAVVWKEFDGEHSILRAMLSPDRGEHFSDSDIATTADASDQPHLLNYGGRFHVIWNTRREPLRVVALPQP
jgi:hypothetical protein